jgi:hypothetical protein
MIIFDVLTAAIAACIFFLENKLAACIIGVYGPIWYNFMSSFTSSFTTSIAKQPTLCPTLWLASLKTHSHRVKHMVKLQKHGSSSPPLMKLLMELFSKKQLYR